MSLPPDPMLERLRTVNAIELGGSFKPEEEEYLRPFVVAINSVLEQYLVVCHENCRALGIVVQPGLHGEGLFCVNGIRLSKKGPKPIVTLYQGVLEVEARYKGRLNYAIKLPNLRVGPRVSVGVILCGFSARAQPYNAVVHNHACRDTNICFDLVPVDVFAYPEERRKKAKLEETYERFRGVDTDKKLFSYFGVVGVVNRDVPPGGELLVSYNRPVGVTKVREDHNKNYFMREPTAEKVRVEMNEKLPGSDHVLVPCTCEPSGCPGNRFYVIDKAHLPPPPSAAQPGAASSSAQAGAAPPAP